MTALTHTSRSVPYSKDQASLFRGLCTFQGCYFLVTGLWPLLDIVSFQLVTGPKIELWLVRTVGVLVTVIALPMLVAAWRGRVSLEVGLLAAGSALGLGLVDVVYVLAGVIPPVYLADAALEAVLLLGWCVVLVQALRANRQPHRPLVPGDAPRG